MNKAERRGQEKVPAVISKSDPMLFFMCCVRQSFRKKVSKLLCVRGEDWCCEEREVHRARLRLSPPPSGVRLVWAYAVTLITI